MKLGSVADIIIGILVNREKSNFGNNSYRLFHLKNYENGIEEYETITTSHSFDRQLTRSSDLLFRLTCPNKVVYVSEKEANLLIPSQMCIIRTNPEKLDPIFLKWYFESEAGQTQLAFHATGTTIQKISVENLRNLEIPNLDLSVQKKLKDLIELWDREKAVLKKTIEIKDNLYNTIIEEIIEEKEK